MGGPPIFGRYSNQIPSSPVSNFPLRASTFSSPYFPAATCCPIIALMIEIIVPESTCEVLIVSVNVSGLRVSLGQ